MAFGAALAVLPALAWFSAGAPPGHVRATGLAAAGELWLVSVLGALTVLAGAGLLACRPEGAAGLARLLGPAVVVGAALALAWSLRAGIDPPVGLSVVDGGATRTLSTSIDLEPAAVVTPLVAGILVAFGAVVAWSGWHR